jgi:hypothetical protein
MRTVRNANQDQQMKRFRRVMTGNAVEVYVCSPWLRFAHCLHRLYLRIFIERP